MGFDADVIRALKVTPRGEKAKNLLRMRMEANLADHTSDPMTTRMIKVARQYRNRLKGRILDVGCYTGFLYHWLGKPEGYTGIDTWPEAIDVAKEFAPEADFRVADGMKFEGQYDVLWSSQILWDRTSSAPKAIEALRKLAKVCIFSLAEEGRLVELPCTSIGQLNVFVLGE